MSLSESLKTQLCLILALVCLSCSRCADQYLRMPLSQECVNQSLVIGLSAGLGGALLVILLALVVFYATKARRKKAARSV